MTGAVSSIADRMLAGVRMRGGETHFLDSRLPMPGFTRLRDLIDRDVATFALHGDGPAAALTIEPETAAARSLMDSAAGPRVDRRLRAIIGASDAYASERVLHRVHFAATDDGMVAASMVSGMRETYDGVKFTGDNRDMRQLTAAAEYGAREISQGAWAWHAQRVGETVVGPHTTGQLLGVNTRSALTMPARALDDAARTGVHELFHSLGPGVGAAHTTKAGALLEEAAADAFAHVHGADAIRAMGVEPAQQSMAEALVDMAYHERVMSLSALASWAGHDTTSAAGWAELERMLVSKSPDDAITTLVNEAATRTGVDPAALRRVWTNHADDADALRAKALDLGLPGPTDALTWIGVTGQ